MRGRAAVRSRGRGAAGTRMPSGAVEEYWGCCVAGRGGAAGVFESGAEAAAVAERGGRGGGRARWLYVVGAELKRYGVRERCTEGRPPRWGCTARAAVRKHPPVAFRRSEHVQRHLSCKDGLCTTEIAFAGSAVLLLAAIIRRKILIFSEQLLCPHSLTLGNHISGVCVCAGWSDTMVTAHTAQSSGGYVKLIQ